MKLFFSAIVVAMLFLAMPAFNFSALELSSANAVNVTHNYANPLTVNSFSDWFGNLLASIQGVVGWIAVVMIMVGGIVYITSGGSPAQAARGKAIVVTSLIGFAIAVAAPSLLREIRDLAAAGAPGGPGVIATAKTVEQIVTDIMHFLLALIGSLALISFVVGGVQYITSGGDQAKADTAKRTILYSIIAICISGASLVILRQVIDVLS